MDRRQSRVNPAVFLRIGGVADPDVPPVCCEKPATASALDRAPVSFDIRRANVAIDRKILADMAINDPGSFTQLAAIAKEN